MYMIECAWVTKKKKNVIQIKNILKLQLKSPCLKIPLNNY